MENTSMSSEQRSFIKTEIVENHILVVTLDRAEARNAFNHAMAVELETVMDRFDADIALRIAIIKGAGSTFCAGQDLKAAAKGDFANGVKRGGFGIMEKPPMKPIIAAVEGHAYAGGLELALSCDLVVASSQTMFALTEVKWSLVAIGGGALRLPRRIPYHVAMEMILTAQPKSVQELATYGLVNRVTEPGGTYAAALDLARLIVANAPLAVQSSKEVVWRNIAEQWSETDGWQNQKAPLRRVVKSKDYVEGLKSFAERRPAVWSGS